MKQKKQKKAKISVAEASKIVHQVQNTGLSYEQIFSIANEKPAMPKETLEKLQAEYKEITKPLILRIDYGILSVVITARNYYGSVEIEETRLEFVGNQDPRVQKLQKLMKNYSEYGELDYMFNNALEDMPEIKEVEKRVADFNTTCEKLMKQYPSFDAYEQFPDAMN